MGDRGHRTECRGLREKPKSGEKGTQRKDEHRILQNNSKSLAESQRSQRKGRIKRASPGEKKDETIELDFI